MLTTRLVACCEVIYLDVGGGLDLCVALNTKYVQILYKHGS
jgi:hypothetical protein